MRSLQRELQIMSSILANIANHVPGRVTKFDRRLALERKTVSASVIRQVDDRSMTILATNGTVDRAGEIVEPAGAVLDSYRRNPVVLAFHDQAKPWASCSSITATNGGLQATISAPPKGVSTFADEICGLIKSGVLSGWSIGFNPIETEPMNKTNPRGPKRYLKWELLEISVVAVPANADAVVIERSLFSTSGPRPKTERRAAFAERQSAWPVAHGPAQDCARIRRLVEERALLHSRAYFNAFNK
jgi:HK97 family phage prohead protease